MLSGVGGSPTVQGLTGAGGPALGIRSASQTQVAPAEESPRIKANRDGSIQYASGSRAETSIEIKQQTVEPITPLKVTAQEMKGTNLDVQA